MKRPNKKDYLTTNQIEYNQMLNKYYDDLEAYIDILEKQLTLTDVGNCPFEAYAVFCIECDRKGIKPIKHKDYLNLG